MIVALGDVYAQIPQRGAIERAMLALQAQALEQDGCVSFVFAEVLADPGHFLLVQRWRDRGALDAHYRSAAFADYQAAVEGLLVRDSELHLHVIAETVRPVDSSRLDLRQDD
jgi:quinol monooxygenase YgiN